MKLQKQGSATQLVVNDKPMLLLAGELSNSAATNHADIRKALKQTKNSGVNSVFVPAYWELVEPNEGKHDFALVDSVITSARKHDLKIVFIWFGAWKNSMSFYAPLWVKENTKRFPRLCKRFLPAVYCFGVFPQFAGCSLVCLKQVIAEGCAYL